MSFRYVNCMIPVCDGCGGDFVTDYTEHFDSPVQARESTINVAGWRTDGQVGDWCVDCQLLDHEHVPDSDAPSECARCGEPIGGAP